MESTSSVRRIFLGPQGLRAGWGIAIFAAPSVALYLIVLFIRHYYPLVLQQPTGPIQMVPGTTIFSEAFAFAVFALLAFILSLIEKRPFPRYGLSLARALPDFAQGLFWGFAMLSVLIGLLYATHAIAFHGFALHGLPTFTYALAWALAFLFVGLLEEFLFRGYLQYTLTRGLTGRLSHAAAYWISAILLSVGLFAYTHTGNGGETPWGIAAVGLAGITFAFALFRTGTLWWAIGFHTAWDWAQSFFYGTPDSGNLARGHLLATNPTGSALLSGASAGPEGSPASSSTSRCRAAITLALDAFRPTRAPPATPSHRRRST
jgi:membrane protease YdiL (CAAX protease family)